MRFCSISGNGEPTLIVNFVAEREPLIRMGLQEGKYCGESGQVDGKRRLLLPPALCRRRRFIVVVSLISRFHKLTGAPPMSAVAKSPSPPAISTRV